MGKFYNTFVIKISGTATDCLIGHIQHVATQQEEYFEGFDRMNHFISEHLKPPDNGPLGADEAPTEEIRDSTG